MHRLATLIAALLLALPGAAYAQGAGDDQYQDPFGEAPAQQGGGGSGSGDNGLSQAPQVSGGGGSASSGGGGSTSSGSASGGGGASAGSAPAVPDGGVAEGHGADAATAQPSAGAGQGVAPSGRAVLPVTGVDAWWLAFGGLALVAAGVALRRRTAA